VPRLRDQWSVPLLALLALAAPLSVAASQIVLGILLAFLLWRWRQGTPPQRTGIEWPALALVVWALAMIPFSADLQQSALYARRWYLLAPIWIGASLCTTRTSRLTVLAALSAGAVVSAMFGILSFVRKGGARIEDGGQLAGRADPLAGYMTGGGLLMLSALVLAAALLTVASWRHRAWLVAAFGVVFTCLVLTLTRSAWLGFVAGALVMTALARPRWLPVLGVAVLAVALLLPGTLQDRLRSAFDPFDAGNAQRVEMWRTGWQWVQQQPLRGLGDRDLKNEYRSHHAGRPDVEIQGHLHSNLVMFAVIWGIPGLVLALAFLGTIIYRLWRRWRALQTRRAPPAPDHDLARAWCLGGIGAWSGLIVSGLFEWNFGDAEIALMVWLIVGVGLARSR
jgi:O-antigen ligase